VSSHGRRQGSFLGLFSGVGAHIWLLVSEASVHCGGEGVAEQGSSHHGGQEAETEDAWALSFPSPQNYGMLLPTFREGLSP
jgi:hypothetical protein